jgi:hypothetical protein
MFPSGLSRYCYVLLPPRIMVLREYVIVVIRHAKRVHTPFRCLAARPRVSTSQQLIDTTGANQSTRQSLYIVETCA